MDMRFLIQGGTGLLHHDGHADWKAMDIAVYGSRIGKLGESGSGIEQIRCPLFDAGGLLVLPGIIDIHGDAFERQIQPRPGTIFSHEIALADTDRQLVANGITTACHGLTYSWEGGLRGREAAIALLDQVARQRKLAYADHRIELRFENHHADGLRDALAWISAGKIDLLAFNEHLPFFERLAARPDKLAHFAERARCTVKVFLERMRLAQSRSESVASTLIALAGACHEYGIPMASHDDETCIDREHYHGLGVNISEFPTTQDALFTAMALDNRVVMGAPNVLLGGSHCGGLAAIDAVRSCMCDILASDYYYPALLQAPFKLAYEGACTVAEAWRLVSENPAAALGLRDRGRIADGCRADLVIVEASPEGNARLIATIAAGKLVYCAEPERMVTHRPYPLAA